MITAAKAPRPGGVIETPISPARGACAPRCRLVGGVWSWGIGETNLRTNGLESTRVGGGDVVSVKPPTSTARARDPRTRRETVSTLRPRVCGCRATSGMAARVAPLRAQTRNAERITTGSPARTLSRVRTSSRARAALSCPRGVRDREVRASHPAGPRLLDIDAHPLIPRLEDAVLLLELT